MLQSHPRALPATRPVLLELCQCQREKQEYPQTPYVPYCQSSDPIYLVLNIHLSSPLMLQLKSSVDNMGDAVTTPCPGADPCPAPLASRPHTHVVLYLQRAVTTLPAVSCGRASVAPSLSGMSVLVEGCGHSQETAHFT